MGRSLMVQGTGTNVGKSLLVAGLCRAFRARGHSVAPFKPQNMSNNAAVTDDAGEIGRAQALQAMACGLVPVSDMNPVLLKPETSGGAQVIVQGKRLATVRARDYGQYRLRLMDAVMESYTRLRVAHDLVLVEGAGSPAEVNLRENDIANMGFAEVADVPVLLVGDIDRGGIIAQFVGTRAVLAAKDAARVGGFVVNRFRGDPRLFDEGYRLIEERTGWPGFGMLPWLDEARCLPAEDSMDIRSGRGEGLKVVCLVLSRMANFDDLDPLAQEPGVEVVMLRAGQPIPGDTDLAVVPGSKSTRGDLAFLRNHGWDIDLLAHRRRGGHILGICGGYQMLGRKISDPKGIEGMPGESEGLGLLDVETVMMSCKRLAETRAVHVHTGLGISGYEIHIGTTEGPDRVRPFATVGKRPEGAVSSDGRVVGTYLHGMFRDDSFRAEFLRDLGTQPSGLAYRDGVEAALDGLAGQIELHLNLDRIRELAA